MGAPSPELCNLWLARAFNAQDVEATAAMKGTDQDGKPTRCITTALRFTAGCPTAPGCSSWIVRPARIRAGRSKPRRTPNSDDKRRNPWTPIVGQS
jgi:hypothetical protein